MDDTELVESLRRLHRATGAPSYKYAVDRIEQLEEELERFKTAGWRSCIDHIIKPEDECPVCMIIELEEFIKHTPPDNLLDLDGPMIKYFED